MIMDLQGFDIPDGYASETELNTRKLVQQHNRKKKKSGGFQCMGLTQATFKGIMKKGYNVPTPIQRKTIPVILEGKDVVAMARTGSGKTACFLIPLFEILRARSAKTGARALVLSPTRELALQTLKFFRELGKFTGLKASIVLGGDSMDSQFSALHENPDVIIATPGRFVHLCVEMELKLHAVEYVVFDEADRLFEMGFGEQLQEILRRLPEKRQTVLFSATLPKLLVDFARAGLTDPTLIRLDVDTKIPEELKLAFLTCRSEDKTAVLLHLLQTVINIEREQTIIFAATKHHVEYLQELLTSLNIPNTYIYSSLDAMARKLNSEKFRSRKVKVLIVTDVAARGIDIPLLDNVINYNFTAKPKLFVHRVGRVARAGRLGTAYSLIASDEMSYLLDLYLFLGRPLALVPSGGKVDNWDGMLGSVPRDVIETEEGRIELQLQMSSELTDMLEVTKKAYSQYFKSRPPSSKESGFRAKELDLSTIGLHPVLNRVKSGVNLHRDNILEQMKKYRPHSTIFEIGPKAGSTLVSVMKAKREIHQVAIHRHYEKQQQKIINAPTQQKNNSTETKQMLPSTDADIQEAFGTIIAPKRYIGSSDSPRPKKMCRTRDTDNYISYSAADQYTESGFAVISTFEQQVSTAVMDMAFDDADAVRKQRNLMVWDQKKKNFVRKGQDIKQKKIRTEAGTYISASFKSDTYKKWKENNTQVEVDSDEENVKSNKKKQSYNKYNNKKNMKVKGKPVKSELKRPDQILKDRRLKAIRRWRSRGKGKKGLKSKNTKNTKK